MLPYLWGTLTYFSFPSLKRIRPPSVMRNLDGKFVSISSNCSWSNGLDRVLISHARWEAILPSPDNETQGQFYGSNIYFSFQVNDNSPYANLKYLMLVIRSYMLWSYQRAFQNYQCDPICLGFCCNSSMVLRMNYS